MLEEAARGGFLIHEQYQDFLKLRRFRQCLVTHASVALADREAPPRSMREFHYAAALQRTAVPEGVEFSNPATKAAVVTPNPVTIAALDRIAKAWPSTIAFDELIDDKKESDGLAPVMERFFAAGLIDAHSTPRVCPQQPGLRPEVWSCTRGGQALSEAAY